MRNLPLELPMICYIAENEPYMQAYKEVTGGNTLQSLQLLTK